MKLLTNGLLKKFEKHPIGSSQDDDNPEILVHYFNPTGNGDWYVLEAGLDEYEDDILFFGYVKLHDNELGYFTLKQLESVRLPFGLTIERDLYFGDHTLKEVME